MEGVTFLIIFKQCVISAIRSSILKLNPLRYNCSTIENYHCDEKDPIINLFVCGKWRLVVELNMDLGKVGYASI